MHLPVSTVNCAGENFGSVESSLGGSSTRYHRHQGDEASVAVAATAADGGCDETMSEQAAVGELWWTERLVGEAQAEHPGELVRTGESFFLIIFFNL